MLLTARHKWPLLLAGMAVCFRLAFFLFAPPHPHGDDTRQYLQLARNVLAGKGMIAPLKGEATEVPRQEEPFFIYVSAGILGASGGSERAIVLVQAILSGLACLLVYAIGKETTTEKAALLASAIYAVYPPLLLESNILGQDAWLILWVLAGGFLTLETAKTKKTLKIFSAGIVWSFAILTKQLVLFLPVFLIPFAWRASQSWKFTLKYFLFLILTPAVMLSPWIWHNLATQGRQRAILDEMIERLPPPMKSVGLHIITKGIPPKKVISEHTLSEAREAMLLTLEQMREKYPEDIPSIEHLKYRVNYFSPVRSQSFPLLGGTGERELSPQFLINTAMTGAARIVNQPGSLIETFAVPYGNFYIDYLAGKQTRLRDWNSWNWAIAVKLILVLLHLALLGTALAGACLPGVPAKAIPVSIFIYFIALNFLYPASINRFLLAAMPYGIILASHFMVHRRDLLSPRLVEDIRPT